MATVSQYFANICQGVEHWWVAYLTLIGIAPIMNTFICNAYSYLFSCRALSPSGQYQIRLLSDCHVCEQLARSHYMVAIDWSMCCHVM